jgi:predicted nuclease of predicted toxin-antitoxin system
MPSDPSSRSKPPEPLVFFIERSLGKRKVAEALRQAGATVEVHEDHFPADAKDPDWLGSVGRRRWIVLTKDQRIRYRKSESDALLNAGVAAFVLTGGNLTGDEMAAVFVKALPKIRKFMPAIYRNGYEERTCRAAVSQTPAGIDEACPLKR